MAGESKWSEFLKGENYRLVDLGRPAVFLIPSKVFSLPFKNGATIETAVKAFLIDNFDGFTMTAVPNFGFWYDGHEHIMDESVKFEVSFLGKDHIPILLSFLADVARLGGEDCIYITAGQYAALIYPT